MKLLHTDAPRDGADLHFLAQPEIQSYETVIFCHLRWEFVYQRPQHIVSRLSKNHKVLLIEEPAECEDMERGTANLLVVNDNLHLLQPKTGSIAEIKNLLHKYIANSRVNVGWFYSPAFIPLLDYFTFDTVVYDCMDELTLFKGASSALVDQERQLLACADIVFTGGKSLYESKKQLHPNVHCFPSSVDEQHFARAHETLEIPADIARIPAPIAGYFGVIDERIDYALIEEVATRNPQISFVMIGPLAKVDERDLPRRDNIHYLGMKAYASLPQYLRVFDVAMMPFAMNEATRFISPTKTLEYMAAGKPVISTPVKDVVRDYSSCVSIVANAEEFSAALRFALQQPAQACKSAYAEILHHTSWDNTVNRMQSLLRVKVTQ